MTTQTRGAMEMVLAMTVSGTIGWFVVISGQPVLDVVFWRCLFGAITLLAVCGARGMLRRDALTGRQLGLAALGGAAVVLNWLLLFGAYSRATISIATTVYNTQPFILVALGAAFLGERPAASKLGWLAIAFVGVLLLVQARPGGAPSPGYLLGIAMALGAAFFYALAAFVAKRLTGVPPILLVLVQVWVGLLMLAPFAHLPPPRFASGATWPALITLGVVHTGLVFVLLYGAIQKLPTAVAGALSFTYPLVAILVDIVAFGHRPQALQILGGGAVLLAAAGTTLGWPLVWRRSAPAADQA
ncbi:DMT family transporter [Caulobacter sp. LARHSG274]